MDKISFKKACRFFGLVCSAPPLQTKAAALCMQKQEKVYLGGFLLVLVVFRFAILGAQNDNYKINLPDFVKSAQIRRDQSL